MKVEEILKEVLIRLGDENKYDVQNLPQNDEEIASIIKCINMIISEIASDYIPIKKVEQVQAVNGAISYERLSKKLINLKKVTKNGMKIGAKMYPSEIITDESGLVEVEYCYIPNEVGLGDTVELLPQVTLMLLTNGVLGEYCLLLGRYEDSMLYDKRYREMLKVASRVTKEIKLKPNRW